MERTNAALVLLSAAIALNIVILIRGEEGALLPLAAVILLAVVGISLMSQRRGY